MYKTYFLDFLGDFTPTQQNHGARCKHAFSSLKSAETRKALNPEPFDELFLGSDLPFVVKVRWSSDHGKHLSGYFFELPGKPTTLHLSLTLMFYKI